MAVDCPCEKCQAKRAAGNPRPLCACQDCQDQARAKYFAPQAEYIRNPHPTARPKHWTPEMKADDLEYRLEMVAEIERLLPLAEPAKQPDLQHVLDHPETYRAAELESYLILAESSESNQRANEKRGALSQAQQEAQAQRDRESLYGPGGKQ